MLRFGRGGGTSGELFPFDGGVRYWGDLRGEGGGYDGGVEAKLDGEDSAAVLVEVMSGVTAMVLRGDCCCKKDIQKSDVS